MTAVSKPRVAKLNTALATARNGFCYRTIRQPGCVHAMMRSYRIDPGEKRLTLGRGQVPGRLVTAPGQVSS